MNLVGQTVYHGKYGEGKVASQSERYIDIQFQSELKSFQYPSVFKEHLTIKNEAITDSLLQEIYSYEKKIAERIAVSTGTMQTDSFQDQSAHIPAKKREKLFPRANIAFKCNFCDGGRSDKSIGFSGICSDSAIHNNIDLEKRVWCSSDSPCMQYHNRRINRSELETIMEKSSIDHPVCYESRMLIDWRASAGIVQHGENKGRLMRLNQVQANSICVLTTREPASTEEERFVFAVFLVDKTFEGDGRKEGFVTTSSEFRISLTPTESKRMPFWKYHANENEAETASWHTGLYRYTNDIEAAQILRDIATIKKDTADGELAGKFLSTFCTINKVPLNSVPAPSGSLTKRLEITRLEITG